MIKRFSQPFNVYYGTINKNFPLKYRFTKYYKSEEDAKKDVKNIVTSFYYKNEGKFGLPTYVQISKESQAIGVDIDILYQDHINDRMRFYVIPTEFDSIPERKLKW